MSVVALGVCGGDGAGGSESGSSISELLLHCHRLVLLGFCLLAHTLQWRVARVGALRRLIPVDAFGQTLLVLGKGRQGLLVVLLLAALLLL